MINFYENKHFLNPKYPFRFTKIFPEKMTKQFKYRERIKHCFCNFDLLELYFLFTGAVDNYRQEVTEKKTRIEILRLLVLET